MRLVALLCTQRRYAEADQLMETLLDASPPPRSLAFLLSSKGGVLSACEENEAALPWYEAAVETHGGSASTSRLAEALLVSGKKAASGRLAEAALSAGPSDAAVVRRCVRVLLKTGRREYLAAALPDFARQKGLFPDYYAAVAQGLDAAGNNEDALKLARSTARRYKEHIEVACACLPIVVDHGKPSEARTLARRLLRLDPASHGRVALIFLISICAELNDYARMLEYAVQANAEFPDESTAETLRIATKTVGRALSKKDTEMKGLKSELTSAADKHRELELLMAGYDPAEKGTKLEYALGEDEGWHIEFKREMPTTARDLAVEIAALSSVDDGGTIFLGVTDDGDVVGVEDTETMPGRDRWRLRIGSLATKSVQPPNPVTVYFNEAVGRRVVKIWVPRGIAPIYYVNNIPYIRNLAESRKATPEEVAACVASHQMSGIDQRA